MDSFGDKIKPARKAKGMTQYDLSVKMNISNTVISNWENGVNRPDVDNIEILCGILGIEPHDLFSYQQNSDDYITKEERRMISAFRSLDSHGKEAVEATLNIESKRMDEMREQDKQENDNKILKLTPHKIPKYEFRASAGTGQFLDSSPYEMVELGEDEPQDASFLVTITGDSMEPTYYNGDTLYIKQQPEVGIGEVGLFAIDGQVFVKEMAANGLKSRNPKYKMIKFRDGNYVHCYGKVIGIKESNVPRPMMTVAAFDGEIKGAHTIRSPVT